MIKLSSSPAQRRTGGFSLIELFAVLGIMAVIAAIGIPMMSGVLKSSKLNSASRTVVDQLAFARQTALARNCRVEVRFYELPEAGGTKAFYGISSFVISNVGTATPLGKIVELPRPVIISRDSSLNTLFRDDDEYKGKEQLPKHGEAEYYKVSFFPSGRTDFDPGSNWFLTLYDSQHANLPAGELPTNYAVLQVDGFTGHVRVFRP